jgi:hypothetical protein
MVTHLLSASALMLLLAASAHADSQPALPQTMQINPQQQPAMSLKPEEEAKPQQDHPRDLTVSIPQPVTINMNYNPVQKTAGDDEEGTEYWPKFWGLHLKITDSLLALFTFLLVIATCALWFGTRKLWKITRDEYVITHRPRFRIRKITFDGFTDTEFGVAFITIVNIGESEATITGIGGGYAQKVGGQWVGAMPDPSATGIPPDPVLIPSQPRTIPFATNALIKPGHAAGYRNGDRLLFIIGQVRYQDKMKITRSTGFGWLYNPRTGEFHKPKKDDEYNYED